MLQLLAFKDEYPGDIFQANTYVAAMVNELDPNDQRREDFNKPDFAPKVIATGEGGCAFNRDLEKVLLMIIKKIDHEDLMENEILIELTLIFQNQNGTENPCAIQIVGFTPELNHTIPVEGKY